MKIQIQGVGKEFRVRGAGRSFTALDDVTLDVRAGELLTLVGPSGCGKSTLLDLLAGLTEPTSGRILLDGAPVDGPGLDRGIVFQQYALFPWRTALSNVEFGLAAKAVPRKERAERARSYLDLVGLRGFEERYPHELSGGMRQRVAIARSLAFDPDVLLMDEPFAALDAQTRESLQEELLRIWEKTGKTIVFITHGAALALLPVFVLILGLGETSKISIILYACAWPILLNTVAGVKSVDPLLIKSARSMGLRPVRLFQKVILPAAVPTIFTGIRLAGAYSILVLVAAEMVGAKAGLGYLITYAQFNFRVPDMYAGILTISVLGLLFNQLLVRLARRFSTWRTT